MSGPGIFSPESLVIQCPPRSKSWGFFAPLCPRKRLRIFLLRHTCVVIHNEAVEYFFKAPVLPKCSNKRCALFDGVDIVYLSKWWGCPFWHLLLMAHQGSRFLLVLCALGACNVAGSLAFGTKASHINRHRKAGGAAVNRSAGSRFYTGFIHSQISLQQK